MNGKEAKKKKSSIFSNRKCVFLRTCAGKGNNAQFAGSNDSSFTLESLLLFILKKKKDLFHFVFFLLQNKSSKKPSHLRLI